MVGAASAQTQSQKPNLAVEIESGAEQLLEPHMTRRLVALELADVEVPPDPRNGRRRPGLFFRVLKRQHESLRIELWDRGEFYGARRVSSTHGSSAQIRARRIALAAAELARGMRRKRLAQARDLELQREHELAQAEREKRAERDRTALASAAVAALVGPGDGYLVGPSLTLERRYESKLHLGLGASWLFGQLSSAVPSAGWSWLEARLSISYSPELSDRVWLDFGGSAAAATLNLTRASSVDGIAGESQTWSARAASFVGLEAYLSRRWHARLAPEVGVLLRRAPFEDASGERRSLGGLWLGLGASLVLDPSGPLR